MANTEFAGFLYNDAGAAIVGATVELFDRNTTTPVRASTTTDANGYWTISHATEGRFDIRITNGSSQRFRKYDDAVQLHELEVSNLLVRNPASTFSYDIVPTAITADRQLNLPLLTGTDTLVSRDSGGAVYILFIGDTANTGMTTGLTINQGASDDEILAFKSSDVAHGMTGLAETDTWARFHKNRATGGLVLRSLSGEVGTDSFFLQAVASSADSTRSTAGTAPAHLWGAIKSGTSDATVGANGNLVVISDRGTVRFIFDSDGESHQDVGTAWIAFDDYDDLALMRSLAVTLARSSDPIKAGFMANILEHRQVLEALPGKPIVTFNDDGHHFLNTSRLAMLHHGALLQVGDRLLALENENTRLKDAVEHLNRALEGRRS